MYKSISASEEDFSEILSIMLKASFLAAARVLRQAIMSIFLRPVPHQPILLCSKS